MMDRRNALCVCLILAFPRLMMAADDVSVKGSMTIGPKTYKLTSVKAFRIKSDERDSIAVIVSQKPFEMSKPEILPSDNPRWIDLRSISLPTEVKEIRDVVPHLQAVFDEKTVKITSYQGWADGTTFMSTDGWQTITGSVNGSATQRKKRQRGVSGNWTAKIEGNRIVGSGAHKDDAPPSFPGTRTSFEFEFKSAIEQLDIKEVE